VAGHSAIAMHTDCKLEHDEEDTKTNKLRGLSPQANYVDRATAACRRS
jgi:hypothetical protein